MAESRASKRLPALGGHGGVRRGSVHTLIASPDSLPSGILTGTLKDRSAGRVRPTHAPQDFHGDSLLARMDVIREEQGKFRPCTYYSYVRNARYASLPRPALRTGEERDCAFANNSVFTMAKSTPRESAPERVAREERRLCNGSRRFVAHFADRRCRIANHQRRFPNFSAIAASCWRA